MPNNLICGVARNLERWAKNATMFQKGITMFVSHMQGVEPQQTQLTELRKLFMACDKDNDGHLSKKELQAAIEKAIEGKPDDFL